MFSPATPRKRSTRCERSRRRHVVTALSLPLSLSLSRPLDPLIGSGRVYLLVVQFLLSTCAYAHPTKYHPTNAVSWHLAYRSYALEHSEGFARPPINQQRHVIRDYSSAPTAPFNPQSSPICSACPPAARRGGFPPLPSRSYILSLLPFPALFSCGPLLSNALNHATHRTAPFTGGVAHRGGSTYTHVVPLIQS
jgi:hypothetical protein